jgi:myo-inositol-1(or 4)-monophosphatase
MNNYGIFIESILKHASQIANEKFGKVSGIVKAGDNNQVLTETDLEIGKYIVGQITDSFPEHNIIDEEAGVINNGSKLTWVVDPIDGTSNFANGVPTYGIMIGLLSEDRPVAGGIAIPAFDEIYVASKSTGATCNGERISVTEEPNLLNALVAYGIDGHQ